MNTSSSTFADQANYAGIIIQPIHFTLAMITNTLNILIFTRRRLRSFPCTHYFLVHSIFSILYTCSTFPLQALRSRGIIWTNTPVGCRIQGYILQTTTLEANLMIILASIDRFCASSYSIKLRSLSNMKTTRWIILIGILVSAIYISPSIAIYYYWNGRCLQYPGIYITVYLSSQVVIYYILTLLLMAIFSLLTMLNIRQQLTRVAPFVRFNQNRRTERQISRLMFLQVIAYIIFTIPNGVIYFLLTFIPSMQTPFVQALRIITVLWQQCIFSLSFFLFIVFGSIYRQEMFQLFKRMYRCNRTMPTTDVQVNHRLQNRIKIGSTQPMRDAT